MISAKGGEEPAHKTVRPEEESSNHWEAAECRWRDLKVVCSQSSVAQKRFTNTSTAQLEEFALAAGDREVRRHPRDDRFLIATRRTRV